MKCHLKAYFQRPLTHLKRRAEGLRNTAPELYFQKPDGDNLAKFAFDCLSGLAYHDDAQVHDMRVTKHWTVHHPRTELDLQYLP